MFVLPTLSDFCIATLQNSIYQRLRDTKKRTVVPCFLSEKANAETVKETEKAIHEAFQGKFGLSGQKVVLEERLHGPEVSVFALCDGVRMILLPPAQDHKRLGSKIKGQTLVEWEPMPRPHF